MKNLVEQIKDKVRMPIERRIQRIREDDRGWDVHDPVTARATKEFHRPSNFVWERGWYFYEPVTTKAVQAFHSPLAMVWARGNDVRRWIEDYTNREIE